MSSAINAAIDFDGPDTKREADIPPEVHDIFRARWSPRAFADRPVSDRDLKTVLEAARWAASSNNEQPWRFLVARKRDTERFQKFLSILVPFNQSWAKSAPVLIITAAKRTFTKGGAENLHARHDAGAALAHLALQATALGMHVHSMAGFDANKATLELGIPDDYEPVTAVALGYWGSPDDLAEPYRSRELAVRERKPLKDLVFDGYWDKPLGF